MSLTKSTILTATASVAVLMMTGGAFAKTFEAIYAVSIHSHASKTSGVVDKLYEGEHVKVQECDDDNWCFITHSGPDGWVPIASLERVGGGYDEAPTIVIQGGFDWHPKKPPIVVDPGPHKPPFGDIVGTVGGLQLDPGTGGGGGGGNGGGVIPPNGGNNGGPIVCYINKPCHKPL
jgi:Bacterial SH3 domain